MPPPIIRIGRICRAHDAPKAVAPGMGERSGNQRRSRSTHHRDAGAPRLMGMVCGSAQPMVLGSGEIERDTGSSGRGQGSGSGGGPGVAERLRQESERLTGAAFEGRHARSARA